MQTHTHKHTQAHGYVYTHAYTQSTHAYIHTCTQTYTDTSTHACAHTHTRTHDGGSDSKRWAAGECVSAPATMGGSASPTHSFKTKPLRRQRGGKDKTKRRKYKRKRRMSGGITEQRERERERERERIVLQEQADRAVPIITRTQHSPLITRKEETVAFLTLNLNHI